MPKTILITPNLTKVKQIDRANIGAKFANFLMDEGFLPLMPVFHLNFQSQEQIQILAKSYFELEPSALVLTGGASVDPSFYGGQKNERSELFRDYFELALIELALERNIPILGICRGMQLLNVYFGGSLKILGQDSQKHAEKLDEKHPETLDFMTLDKMHQIELNRQGLAYQVLGQDKIWVNSVHSQGLDRIGTSLSVEAVAEDGLVEIISNLEKKILATQWHPDVDPTDEEYRKVLEIWLSWLKN